MGLASHPTAARGHSLTAQVEARTAATEAKVVQKLGESDKVVKIQPNEAANMISEYKAPHYEYGAIYI